MPGFLDGQMSGSELGLLGGVAEGFKQGITAYQDQKKRQMDVAIQNQKINLEQQQRDETKRWHDEEVKQDAAKQAEAERQNRAKIEQGYTLGGYKKDDFSDEYVPDPNSFTAKKLAVERHRQGLMLKAMMSKEQQAEYDRLLKERALEQTGIIEGRKMDLNEQIALDKVNMAKDANATKEKIAKEKPKPAAKAGSGLTVGEQAVDRNFAKEYADWNAAGGSQGVTNKLSLLDQAVEKLRKNPELTGPTKIVGNSMLGSAIGQRLNPETYATGDLVKRAIQETLRQTMGAQFTEKEGTDLYNRSWNPALSAEKNIEKILIVKQELLDRAAAKDKASNHFGKYGTLKGLSLSPIKDSVEPRGLIGNDSKIRVSNGKETLSIDPSDLKNAEKDGYKQVK